MLTYPISFHFSVQIMKILSLFLFLKKLTALDPFSFWIENGLKSGKH